METYKILIDVYMIYDDYYLYTFLSNIRDSNKYSVYQGVYPVLSDR